MPFFRLDMYHLTRNCLRFNQCYSSYCLRLGEQDVGQALVIGILFESPVCFGIDIGAS